MPTVDITDGKVFPQDVGTDAPSDYTQPDSAGFFGGMARHAALLQYVETGLDFFPDYGNNTLDVASGMAFLLVDDAITVQNEAGEYSETWHSGMAIAVDVPTVTGIQLGAGDTNHVYLAADMSAGDGTYYEVNTTGELPVDPHVKIGTVDTSTDTAEELNREMEGEFGRLFVSEIADDPDAVINKGYADAIASDLSTHTGDTSNPHSVTATQTDAVPDTGGTFTGGVSVDGDLSFLSQNLIEDIYEVQNTENQLLLSTSAEGAAVRLYDRVNNAPILDANVGGDVSIPRGALDVSGDISSTNQRKLVNFFELVNNQGRLVLSTADPNESIRLYDRANNLPILDANVGGRIDIHDGPLVVFGLTRTNQLGGGVVNRSETITNLEGNVWHLQDGESLPSDAEPGDTVIRYE